MDKKNVKLSVVGLGYVGLPLAVAFSEKFKVVGYDIEQKRIEELKNGYDKTLEVEQGRLKRALDNKIEFTHKLEDIKDCNIYIVTVPTPIDDHNNPDLTPLVKASETVGSVLKNGDTVIYESTVYPGCTEEVCVPILERVSGLKYISEETCKDNSNLDLKLKNGFYCGYSPERINPGDKNHRVENIKKVISGSTKEAAEKINELYSSIIAAGTHMAASIKVAEAAKVIENSQRDINIAFVNELALIFDKLNIDTLDVLKAAGTKWNFLPFKPGLVGGHCISVDPYYLAYKAKEVGYHPEIILSGRRLNDNMGIFVANKVIKLMIKKGHKIKGSRVLILGVTFKENCPDIRNSRIIDIVRELDEFGINVDVYDQWADKDEVKRVYNIDLIQNTEFDIKSYDAVICAVAHDGFKELGDMLKERKSNTVVFDIKGILNRDIVDGRL